MNEILPETPVKSAIVLWQVHNEQRKGEFSENSPENLVAAGDSKGIQGLPYGGNFEKLHLSRVQFSGATALPGNHGSGKSETRRLVDALLQSWNWPNLPGQ